MNKKRVRTIKKDETGEGPVAVWMSRDQRAEDNWALLYAKGLAEQRGAALGVVFCLVDDFLGATLRQYDFMLRGLRETAAELSKKNIPFFLLRGEPGKAIPAFCAEHEIGTLVTDFDPLRIKRAWKEQVAERVDVPFYEVDAHNIVPCWAASGKEEYGAYTIRPRLHRQLGEFLEDFPPLRKHSVGWKGNVPAIDWDAALAGLKMDRTVEPVDWLEPGTKAGRNMLAEFIDEKLADYDTARNNPTLDGQSNLSPYLHFGQISAQRAAWEVQNCKATLAAKEAFLDELITWRELSDNFCFYNENYDNTGCFAEWAKETLDRHRKDRRMPAYHLETLEKAETHDELWNAAQLEMVRRGKMHGYMRMYWAKKILEWSASPEEAVRVAIYLNDKYEIDGRDPNGYANIAWSIGGVHDHGWRERPIFGKIRYMSYNGAKSKFDIEAYIRRYGYTAAE